ncbi:heavy metal translocating P-type ATPase [Miltoncostaea marina]|uniref:heavy metal translocating P-type ATPase n=1 Tax=Miltoncostaea marina TaxID=2843215 RepID=UPI001C3C6E10|nr:cation-translocating P-type ATPase [Miltoncostaea marina]
MRPAIARALRPAARRWTVTAASAALIVAALAAGAADRRTAWASLMLAATAVAGAGIALRAARALRHRIIGIELLVTVAVAGAVAIGELWEAAAVTVLFTAGAALEGLTLTRTRGALRELLALAPVTATVVRDGRQVVVDPREVALGERVIVKPGGTVPVDGVVAGGAAALDERSLTGESMPRDVGEGDRVLAGSVVSDGWVTLEASGVGDDTALARMIRRVEEAQDATAPAQRLMERFAARYTPAVVAAAGVAWALSGDVRLALTLLVISCPGALVISMPVSVVAGIGHAARRGILIKGGEHLETAARIDAVALDKTGTLTRGRPEVAAVVPADPAVTPATVLGWAAAVEAGSEHPLAAAIVAAATAAGVPVPAEAAGFASRPGLGVEGDVDGAPVAVGTLRLMDRLGIAVPPAMLDELGRLADGGATAVLVAREGRVAGVLAMRDELRPDAVAAVAALRAAGIRRIAMLTGDAEPVARAVAARVGIDEVRAGLLPEDKLRAIRSMQAGGAVVAMVGDGVNDAPALAAADVGVAMGAAGTDVAVETADVALMGDSLPRVAEAVSLARRTVRTLRQNVAVALATVAVLTGGVLLGEVEMAGGMLVHQVSVLAVILNAMRLLRDGAADDAPGRAGRRATRAGGRGRWAGVSTAR